ncbi:Rrf2 family protein [Streptomyces sp. V1I1]|nr:Rrf2 family protein [Streptomyces sp. V1I1]
MKMSGGVEWALHCCVVLTSVEEPVPATRLAELHDVSASYPAKQLQALSRAGLVRSVQGKAGGYVLTREPASITVLNVVRAGAGRPPPTTQLRGMLGTAPAAGVEARRLPT